MTGVRCGWCGSSDWKQVGVEWSGHAILACKGEGCGHEWVETTMQVEESKFLKMIMDPVEMEKIMVEISQGWPNKERK